MHYCEIHFLRLENIFYYIARATSGGSAQNVWSICGSWKMFVLIKSKNKRKLGIFIEVF